MGPRVKDYPTVLNSFLTQFYGEAAHVPPDVLLPAQIEEANIIENWLGQRRGSAVRVNLARDKNDQDLLDLARQNAGETLTALKAQWDADSHRQESTLKELQDALDLPRLPTRIECFDISNTQGTAMIGAMVVFAHGQPRKADYRKFNIKDIQGPNDFESMWQALSRRFQRWKDRASEEKPGADPGRKTAKIDASFSVLPDLLVIDGGNGQLGVAVEVLKSFDLLHVVPVISLAKREEEVFKPATGDPIGSPASRRRSISCSVCAMKRTDTASPGTAPSVTRSAWHRNLTPSRAWVRPAGGACSRPTAPLTACGKRRSSRSRPLCQSTSRRRSRPRWGDV